MPDGSKPRWAGYAELYERGPYTPFVEEIRLAAGGPIRLLRAAKPAGRYPDPATPDLVLLLATKASGHGYVDLGASHGHVRVGAGKLAIAPPNGASYELSDAFELLILTIPFAQAQQTVGEASGGALADFAPLHRHDMPHDPVIASLMARLWVEAAAGNPMGLLYAEDAAAALAARLARMAIRASGARDLTEDTPPLHGARLARVLQSIEDELDGTLRQADLAALAKLSPWHFARAFKSATGVAPHRFVLLRRLARAQWMLRATRLSLAEVAAACGFSSHAHLTTFFRREVGAKPSDWRRAIKE